MTDSVSDVSTSHTGRIAPVWLVVLCVGALTFYLLMLRSSPAPAKGALVLPLVGFALAWGAGICLGLWWPTRPRRDAQVVQKQTETEAEPVPDVATPVARHSALVEEEHIVGGHQLHVKADTTTNQADFDGAMETVAITLPVELPPENDAPDTTPTDVERQRDELDEVLAASDQNDAAPEDTSAQSNTDRKEFEDALNARDQVIESLEDIVKENRDRWSDFEAQRDELREKIENLEAELRIANDIIDGARGTSDDEPFERPQVLSRA